MTSREFGEWVGTYVMILAALVSFVFALDPAGYEWGGGGIAAIKYLPAELPVIAMLCFALGRRSMHPRPRALHALTVFAALVLLGATYTVVGQHHTLEDSFLGRGLNMLAVFPAFMLARRPRQWRAFWRWVRWPAFGVAFFMLCGLAAWQLGIHFANVPNIYHEEIFLPTSAAVAAYVLMRPSGLRWLAVAAYLCAGALTVKFTGFLATSLAGALILWLVLASPGTVSGAKMLRVALLGGAIACAVAISVVVVMAVPGLMPTGSPKVRLVTYALRAAAFLRHPVIGTAFTGSPMIVLPRGGNQAPLTLPSHSDLLDLLAFGGIVGSLLLGIPVVLVLRSLLGRLYARARAHQWVPVYLTAVLTIMTMEVVFNPLWNQPQLMYFFWLALGAGLAMTVPSGPGGRAIAHRPRGEHETPERSA